MSGLAEARGVEAVAGDARAVDAQGSEGPRLHDPRRDHAAIRRLADELLPALMARLEDSPLGELEVSQDGWRVRLRKPADAPNGTGSNGARAHGTVGTGTAAGRPRGVQ